MTRTEAKALAFKNLEAQRELHQAVIDGVAYGDPEVSEYVALALESALWALAASDVIESDEEYVANGG